MILHEDTREPGNGGGAESLLRDMTESLVRRGHVIAWWQGSPSLQAAIEQFKPDVCHIMTIHNLLGLAPAVYLQEKGIKHSWALMDYWPFCGGRMLLKEHDVECNAVTGHCNGACPHGMAPAHMLATVNRSPIVALNPYTADIYRRNGIAVAETVTLGIDTDVFQPAVEKRIPGRILATSAWASFPTKGMHVLRSALEQARASAQIVTGVTRLQVRDALQTADVYVFPSTYQETWGLCLTEAMACGCACIASEVAGPRAQIEHGETGLLYQNRNAAMLAEQIGHLLAHPEEARRLGENARQRVEATASLAAMGERWERWFTRVAEGL